MLCFFDNMQETYTSPIIETFLSKYVKAATTKCSYRSALKRYFTLLGAGPETYFTSGRNYEDDIMKFAKSFKKAPAKTFSAYIAAVKKFLIRNGANITPFVWEDVKGFRTGTRPVTIDRTPTHEELRNILTHADLQTRAMGLVLSSSGMRIGECCKFQLDDINWNTNPVKINLLGEYTKSGNGRYVFISHETENVLREWLKVRKNYLENAVKRLNVKHIEKTTDDDRVFPITTSMARYLWNKCLKNAECAKRDKTTKYHELHIHVLRKRFLSLLKLEIPEVVVEALAGHDAYLSEAYRRYSEKQMAEYYMKGVNSLLVFERENKDISKVQEQLSEKDKEIQELNKRLESMDRDIRKLMIDRLTENDREKK